MYLLIKKSMSASLIIEMLEGDLRKKLVLDGHMSD